MRDDDYLDTNYLTMARIEDKEWRKWSKENMRPDDIGHTIIRARSAFKDGFFAGFQGRYFNNEEN